MTWRRRTGKEWKGAAIVIGSLAGASGWAQDWGSNFRLGAQMAFGIDAKFSVGGDFLAGDRAGPAGVGGVNHLYEDGFVRVDDTGNAQGYTSYWSYDNPAQYDAGAQRLTYHSTSSYSIENRDLHASDDPHFGVELVYNQDIFGWDVTKLGWELGFGMLPLGIQDRRSFRGQTTRQVHQFDTGGIVVPGAPYIGGSSGVGPTILDVATALPDEVAPGQINIKQDLDVDLYQIWLGPSARWRLAKRVTLRASAGMILGIADGDYEFEDRIAGQEVHSDRISETELAYGGYLNGLIMYHGDLADDSFDVYLGLAYRSLTGVEWSQDGRKAELGLDSGLYVSAGVAWSY